MHYVTDMQPGQGIRQGDLLIERIGDVATPYTVGHTIQDGILALGEVTGHAHSAVADPATLRFSFEDLAFLTDQQDRLSHPLVFTDDDCRRQERSTELGVLVQHVVAKIHAGEPFCIVHWDQRTMVVPATTEEAQRHQLHDSWQLPAGLYRVIRQVEPTEENRTVND